MMKRHIFLLLVLPLLFVSCHNSVQIPSTENFINSSQNPQSTENSGDEQKTGASSEDVDADQKTDGSPEKPTGEQKTDAEQKTESSGESSTGETGGQTADSGEKSENENPQNPEENETTNKLNLNPNDYKFLTLHKVNQSKDFNNYIIVFLGDGFTKDEQNFFEEKVKAYTQNLFKFEPFKTYKNQITVYGISTVSNESGISNENFTKDSYLKVLRYGNYFSFSDEDKKFETLIELLEKTFDKDEAENAAKVSTIHVVCNENSRHGGSLNPRWSFSTLADEWKNGETAIHELGHSIGRLGDEYRVLKETFNTSKNKENVPWKKFIGFNGIGIVEPTTQMGQNVYIPSHSCIMNENLDSAFCEVCKWALACRINSALYRKNHDSFYVAKSQILSSTEKADTYEFKTIVQNLQNQNKKIKLILKSKNGTYKIQKEFDLPGLSVNYPDNFEDFDNSCILISESLNAPSARQIEAQIIDCESSELLASFKNY